MSHPTNTHTGVPAASPRLNAVPAAAPRAVLAMGAVGAIVGGTASAARNIARVKNDEISKEDAVKDSLKEAGTTGLATAVAAAAVSAVGLTGALSLAGMVVAAIGAKYVADKALSGKPSVRPKKETSVAEAEAEEKPVKKTAKKAAEAKK